MTTNLAPFLYQDEKTAVERLAGQLAWDERRQARVRGVAEDLVRKVRAGKRGMGELESFLQEYGLDTDEGLALMTLAEALLRIPDARTASALIHDKMAAAEWLASQGNTKDLLVRVAGYGLNLTHKVLNSALARLSEPVVRAAMVQAMRILGKQFVLGRTIEEGLKNARPFEKKGYRLSYDMLGEGARTAAQAEGYFEAYGHALAAIGAANGTNGNGERAEGGRPPGLSVKLSALHPRYEFRRQGFCVPELTEKLLHVARTAAANGIAITVDAEEVDRLEVSLQIIEAVFTDKSLAGWEGFGLAVQAYSKRTPALIDHLTDLAKGARRRLQVRLVKGAYWDAEIKRAQVLGLDDYPVFTRKVNTDLSYLACAQKLLSRRDVFYPMFATHNAFTVAAVRELAGNDTSGFEYQRLHGMGEALHDAVIREYGAEVSIYAPCGSHEELLPYLVRRLLENGASTSFVHRISDERVPIEEVIADPVTDAATHPAKRHPKIPLPRDLYAPARLNSPGIDLTEQTVLRPLLETIRGEVYAKSYLAAPFIGGRFLKDGTPGNVVNPADRRDVPGKVHAATDRHVAMAFEKAMAGFQIWRRTPAAQRAAALERLAALLEENRTPLIGLLLREAGRTLDDALSELREAADFCRYYAAQGRALFDEAGQVLPGPTGEHNALTLEGRGVFVCISPWNFPLAIFLGQIGAALMAGNAVIAKPAEQTPLIAALTAELIIKAGVPADAFALLPGDGATGAASVAHPGVSGVAFTGSGAAAVAINRALAARDGPIVPLIAETGGQNAMIVDSSALPEQVVDDVMTSAFGSAGQRCSALRVLYVQEDIADKVIELIRGAMALRLVGDPLRPETDIGPVIDAEALGRLEAHRAFLEKNGRLIAETHVDAATDDKGHFFAPLAYEIDTLADIKEEVFGPVLHVIRYRAADLKRVIDEINAAGYGLTFGLHSRIDGMSAYVTEEVNAGNIYVNRSMIGAVVGVQPFGGHGLSGTGPKAGGPHYLPRFATEKTVSVDTTRQGGNASLVSMEEKAGDFENQEGARA